MIRIRTFLSIIVAIHFPAMALRGCPICLGIVPQKPTFADELISARDVVVAHPAGAKETFEVGMVVKGDVALKSSTVQLSGIQEAGSVILSRATADATWVSQGSSGVPLIRFFDTVRALPPAAPASDVEWTARLAAFRPFLGHSDPRIARSAWAEWARAPYRMLRLERLQAEELRAWLLDPAQSFASPMWLVLLGVSGDAEDARHMNEQLEAAWKKNDASLTAALLTARIEREGEKGMVWLEEHYIRDRERTLEEIQAAVAALSVQGEASATLRPRILAACRTFIAERRPLSGLVARDLIAWGEWSAESHFQTLITSGEPVLPETRAAISDYLKACRAAAPPIKNSTGGNGGNRD